MRDESSLTFNTPGLRLYGVLWGVLLVTCGLGAVLRWWLAGVSVPKSWSFAHIKHAHSHLGYFGLLFPSMWLVWHQRLRAIPSLRALQIYGVGVLLSTFGFLRAGYGLEAIIGSTLVLAIWLVSAWQQRRQILQGRDWSAAASIGIVLASVCIPVIAVMTKRAPAKALLWVQTFLSLLLLLVLLPVWLERWRIKPPFLPLWTLCGIAGAAYLGVGESQGWLGLGLAGLGAIVLWGLSQKNAMETELQFWWAGWALGAVLLGIRVLDNQHAIAMAGLHYAVLGPFTLSAIHIWKPARIPLWWRGAYALSLLGMCASIGVQQWRAEAWIRQSTAVTGSLVLVLFVVLGFWWWKNPQSSVTTGRGNNSEEVAG